MGVTTDENDPGLKWGTTNTPGPQNDNHLILSDEERSKGFIRPVRTVYTHLTCGMDTRMGVLVAETYARNPKFYGATYCIYCRTYRPVGENGEFVWKDTNEKVGT